MIQTQIDHQSLATELMQQHPALQQKIIAATQLDASQATHMLREVLRFLHLISNCDGPLTPPLVLDLAWHEFILFTRAYSAYCQKHFGRFIHHTPGGSDSENRSQLRRTLKRYDLAFGPPNPIFWGDQGYYGEAANCGACEG